jgi:hypothetical protein
MFPVEPDKAAVLFAEEQEFRNAVRVLSNTFEVPHFAIGI